jgi:PAS domain S-box-containing protein
MVRLDKWGTAGLFRMGGDNSALARYPYSEVLFDSLPLGLVFQNATGQIVAANPAAARILGLSIDQMRGLTSLNPRWRAVRQDGSPFPGEDHPASVVLRTGQSVFDVQMGVFNPEREDLTWININAFPIRDETTGALEGAYTIFDDISERKRLEKLNIASAAELAEAQRIAHIGSWYWHAQTDQNEVSDELRQIFGRQDIPAFSEQRGVLYPAPAWDQLNRAVHEAVRTGMGYDLELPALRADGSRIWINTRCDPVRSANGDIVGLRGTVQDITSRVQGQQQLRENEERLQLALTATSEALWDWDLRSGNFYRSPRFDELIGRQALDQRSDFQSFICTVHPDDRPGVLALIDAHRQGQTPAIEFDYRLADESAGEKWMRVKGRAVERDGAGMAVRIVGIVSDVTRRRAIELELAASQQEFRNLAEAIPQIVWIANADGSNTWLNQHWADYTGLSLDESQGQGWLAAFHDDDQLRTWRAWQDATRDGTAYTVEARLRRADGACRWWIVRGTPVVSDKGTITKWFGTCTDIHDIKIAEEEKLAAIKHLESALASMSDAVLISDGEGRFIHFNEAFATFHKFASKADCAKKLADYPEFLDVSSPTGELLPLARWAVPRALRGETATNAEFILHRRDTGETWIGSYNFAPIRDKNGSIVGSVVTGRDITEHKLIELELERARNTLLEAQRIAQVGSFEYVAATRKTVWSEEEYRIYGLDPSGPSPEYDVMLAKSIHPDDAELLHRTFTNAFQTLSIYELEHRIVRPDGSERWVIDRAHPYFESDGTLVRYVGSTLDITDRKQAELALRESEERYRVVF